MTPNVDLVLSGGVVDRDVITPAVRHPSQTEHGVARLG